MSSTSSKSETIGINVFVGVGVRIWAQQRGTNGPYIGGRGEGNDTV
jgi:hypothetical protein